MSNLLDKAKGFFKSGTILASLGTLVVALDQLSAKLVELQPYLPPKAAAAVVVVLSVVAIIKRVTATAKIVGVF